MLCFFSIFSCILSFSLSSISLILILAERAECSEVSGKERSERSELSGANHKDNPIIFIMTGKLIVASLKQLLFNLFDTKIKPSQSRESNGIH